MLTTRKRMAGLSIVAGLILACSALLVQVAEGGAPAPPAPPAAPGAGQSLQSLWEDFLHYIKIAQVPAAKSHGQQILDSNPKPIEIYALYKKFPDSLLVLARGMRLKGLEDICKQLRTLVEKGYRDMRADPKEIEFSIKLLGGTVRQYERGVERLKVSGEYALPQLIQKLQDKTTPGTLRTRIILALPRLGAQNARGLSAALVAEDEVLLEIIANTLGRLESPLAAPRLKELTQRQKLVPRVRRAALAALRVCGGSDAEKKSASELFYGMALKYYYRAESLQPDPRYETANVWRWAEGRLTYTPAPRQIFCDVYAMRMSRLALQYDETFYPAVSLWLSAHIRKEVDLPKGKTDPIRGPDQPAAKYYALASPAVYLQHVLARAMRDKNSAVAVAAIRALGETAGAENLVREVQGGAMPLVQAMTYEDRHVRFLAAVTLANAHPKTTFPGADMVMGVLIEAIRQTGTRQALLTVADPKLRNALKAALRGADCAVIEEADPVQALLAARVAGGVDVVVLAGNPEPQGVLDLLRRDPAFAGVPVLLAGPGQRFKDLAAKDKAAMVVDPAVDAAGMKTALAEAAKLGGAPLSPQEAGLWAVSACEAIRQLGLTKNPVYDVDRARTPLINALKDERGSVQIAAAQALAILPAAVAQQAVVELATTGTKEPVRVAAFKAASESVRRFGRQTTDAQAKAVLAVVMGKGSPDLLNSAAQLLGAMNLPSEKVKELILTTQGMD